VSSSRQFSAVFITSTGSNHELREPAGSGRVIICALQLEKRRANRRRIR
jgi:hypothetical protein